MRKFFCLFFALAVLSGCASKQLLVENFGPKESPVDLMILPYESLGVKKTPSIANGQVWEVRGFLPEEFFGEYSPGRVRWNAWVVRPDGRENFAQAVFAGIDPSKGRFVVQVFSEEELDAESRVILLSTIITYGYDLGGREVALSQKEFLENREYRRKMVLAHGTRIGDWRGKVSKGFPYQWNEYGTPKGDLLSPAGEAEMKRIAGINPGYTFAEKLVARGHFGVSLDPVATVMGIAIDLTTASGAPSTGWDYSSELPNRRVMGVTMAYVLELQQRIFDQVRREQCVGERK